MANNFWPTISKAASIRANSSRVDTRTWRRRLWRMQADLSPRIVLTWITRLMTTRLSDRKSSCKTRLFCKSRIQPLHHPSFFIWVPRDIHIYGRWRPHTVGWFCIASLSRSFHQHRQVYVTPTYLLLGLPAEEGSHPPVAPSQWWGSARLGRLWLRPSARWSAPTLARGEPPSPRGGTAYWTKLDPSFLLLCD